jgi:hypothetical protein
MENYMILKKGFLLLEFIGALFLLCFCVLCCVTEYAQSYQLATKASERHQYLMVARAALEKARQMNKEFYEKQNINNYIIESIVKYDAAYKNFLHIEVRVYDKEKNVETWFSGVALPYEL